LARCLKSGITILDVGCGTGHIAPFHWKQYPKATVIGLDPNPEARKNPQIDEFILLEDNEHWPVEDSQADMVVARYVLEHVASPAAFFANVRRVLKPGGCFLFLTPNIHHPAVFASQHLPHALRTKIVGRSMGVEPDDVFPALYRLNTASRLREIAEQYQFSIRYLSVMEHQPTRYLDFHVIGFLLAYSYYLIVKRVPRLEHILGATIIGVLERE